MTPLLLASVWCLLLLGSALVPWLGGQGARLGAYAAGVLLLLVARPRGRGPAPLLAALFAGASGFAALPAWLALVAALGGAVGLAPARAGVGAPDASAWLANVALAPVLEELLYRERLLPALRARVGAPAALALSSAAFAAPHLEPWSMLTTGCVGLALGGVFLATGRVEPCIAGHAGLNAAALACGLPPERAALPPLAAACLASALIAVAIAVARTAGHGPRPRVHAPRAAARADASPRA